MMGMMGDSPPPWSAAAGELLAAALQRYLPSNHDSDEVDSADFAIDAYSCDEFRMYEFKVRRCARGRAHDWTECPYAHPGEKARRRDPRKYHYSGAACPDFRKGICKRGDGCEFAHGVFECWLHPARYRTQPCKDGTACRRRVCFFAHTPDQLRLLPQQHQGLSPKAMSSPEPYDWSPLRRLEAMSPPVSPTATLSPPAVTDLAASMRKLQLGKAPRVSGGMFGARVFGMGGWKGEEETEVRVESGRALRARMFERLSMEGGLGSPPPPAAAAAPDVGWVSDLLK